MTVPWSPRSHDDGLHFLSLTFVCIWDPFRLPTRPSPLQPSSLSLVDRSAPRATSLVRGSGQFSPKAGLRGDTEGSTNKLSRLGFSLDLYPFHSPLITLGCEEGTGIFIPTLLPVRPVCLAATDPTCYQSQALGILCTVEPLPNRHPGLAAEARNRRATSHLEKWAVRAPTIQSLPPACCR